MFFTQEDYRKIEKWILANGRKDTDFAGAALPLKGNETVAFVQNGKNVNVFLKDLINQIFLLGVSDFLNVTDKYGESMISLTQAIQLIPFRSRKIGQVITFLDEEGHWKLFQFQGQRLNQWNNSTLWADLIKQIEGISIIDSEDITSEKDNLNQVSLKFADKNYNTADYSGLGRIYLRKNIQKVVNPVTNKPFTTNLLTQLMVSKENTIYIIQYDYNLNGQTITIPENCVLQFEGGSISNGTINFDSTTLEGTINIDTDVKGTITNNKLVPEWFGAVGDNSLKDTLAFNRCVVIGLGKTVYLSSGKNYIINNTISISGKEGIIFKGDSYDSCSITSSIDNNLFIINSWNTVFKNIKFKTSINNPTKLTYLYYSVGIENFTLNNKVLSCRFEGGITAIEASHSNRFYIEDCSFIGDATTLYGIHLHQDGSYNPPVENKIYKNVFANYTGSIREGSIAVFLDSVDQTTISDNVIMYYNTAIRLSKTGSYINNLVNINNNNIEAPKTNCILIDGNCYNLIIHDNEIAGGNNSLRGIHVSSTIQTLIINGNIINGIKREGILVTNSYYVIISDNRITDASKEVNHGYASVSVIGSNNININDNNFVGQAASVNYPLCHIKIDNISNFIISGNNYGVDVTPVNFNGSCKKGAIQDYIIDISDFPSGPNIDSYLLNQNIPQTLWGNYPTKIPVFHDGGIAITADGYPIANKRGTTADRPILNGVVNHRADGFTFFDWELGQLLTFNGAIWLNPDGTDTGKVVII